MKLNLLKLFVICAALGLSSLSSAFIPQDDVKVVSQPQAAPVVFQADDDKDDDKKKKK